MIQFNTPIPVIIKESGAEAMAIYISNGGAFENDIWTIVLCKGGDIIHVRTDQIKMHINKTFDIINNI